MAYFVYILRCKDGMLYTGITWNLKKRISQHNLGIKTSIQRSRRPVGLIYSEKYQTRIDAARRERIIKGWKREKKLGLLKSLR